VGDAFALSKIVHLLKHTPPGGASSSTPSRASGKKQTQATSPAGVMQSVTATGACSQNLPTIPQTSPQPTQKSPPKLPVDPSLPRAPLHPGMDIDNKFASESHKQFVSLVFQHKTMN